MTLTAEPSTNDSGAHTCASFGIVPLTVMSSVR
jgi:hypothetical protein